MDIGCLDVSIWILVVGWDISMGIGCVKVSVLIMVVLRLVYGYWLC